VDSAGGGGTKRSFGVQATFTDFSGFGHAASVRSECLMMPPATSVLVVEDEESFVEALSIGLKREGFVVHLARDGREAIDMFGEVKPDVVLLDVTVDPERHEVVIRGELVNLPLKEFELLEELVANAGRLVTRERLIDRVWGLDYVGDTKTLDVHVKRLRAKVEVDPANPTSIITIRGLGYKYELPKSPELAWSAGRSSGQPSGAGAEERRPT